MSFASEIIQNDFLIQKKDTKAARVLLNHPSNMEYTFRAVTHSPGIIIWRIEVL